MLVCFCAELIFAVSAMAPKQPNTGLFVGLNKGHIVTKKDLAPRPSDRKGVSNVLPSKFLMFNLFNQIL